MGKDMLGGRLEGPYYENRVPFTHICRAWPVERPIPMEINTLALIEARFVL